MYKITVKKNLIIFHNEHEWDTIFARMVKEFGVKIAISFVMKRELGFTVRRHQGLVSANSKKDPSKMYYEQQVHLDFYNESTQSWFLLRYVNKTAGKDLL